MVLLMVVFVLVLMFVVLVVMLVLVLVMFVLVMLMAMLVLMLMLMLVMFMLVMFMTVLVLVLMFVMLVRVFSALVVVLVFGLSGLHVLVGVLLVSHGLLLVVMHRGGGRAGRSCASLLWNILWQVGSGVRVYVRVRAVELRGRTGSRRGLLTSGIQGCAVLSRTGGRASSGGNATVFATSTCCYLLSDILSGRVCALRSLRTSSGGNAAVFSAGSRCRVLPGVKVGALSLASGGCWSSKRTSHYVMLCG